MFRRSRLDSYPRSLYHHSSSINPTSIAMHMNDSDIPKPPPPIEVIHADSDLLVLNKPSGTWMHGGPGDQPSALDQLRQIESADKDAITFIHPLETDISGLILAARNTTIYDHLQSQFTEKRLTFTYLAIVRGTLLAESGIMDRPISTSGKRGDRYHVDDENGKPARTEWRLRDSFVGFALLECTPSTDDPRSNPDPSRRCRSPPGRGQSTRRSRSSHALLFQGGLSPEPPPSRTPAHPKAHPPRLAHRIRAPDAERTAPIRGPPAERPPRHPPPTRSIRPNTQVTLSRRAEYVLTYRRIDVLIPACRSFRPRSASHIPPHPPKASSSSGGSGRFTIASPCASLPRYHGFRFSNLLTNRQPVRPMPRMGRLFTILECSTCPAP